MEKIDLSTWERALHYQIFRNYLNPQYCVTFELDITHFLEVIKQQDYSFTFSFVFAVSKCANQIKEFRYRFVDGQPVLFDRINTAFTYLKKDTKLFKVVNVEMRETLEEYEKLASEKEQAQNSVFGSGSSFFCGRGAYRHIGRGFTALSGYALKSPSIR